jgi:hypothetical protein
MIENYRTQRVWKLFMRNEIVRRGLERAGFVRLSSVAPMLELVPGPSAVSLTWDAQAGRTYQVEYSADLDAWFAAPTGQLTASSNSANWIDNGPPGTPATPLAVAQRFYRVFQFGYP